MGFLNLVMLWGLVAASIPIIIHLLNRRRYRVIDWGAMRFLKMSVVTRHRRLKIEELILLILRTLLIVLLVLALARPLIMGLSTAEARRDVVIILDGSMSMSLKEGPPSLFDRARDAARETLRTLRPADSVGVVLGTRSPRALLPELSYDREKVDRALQRSHESLSSFDAIKALDRAFAMLRKGSNPNAEILVITDGQRYGWYTTDSNRWRYVAEQMADLPHKPRITVLALERHGDISNFSIGEIALRRTVVGTDRDVRVTVSVRNTGDRAFGPEQVSFAVDGKNPRLAGADRLDPGTSSSVPFLHRFSAPGSHYIVAELPKDHDQIGLDDRAWFGLEVLDSLPVLLVDGSGSIAPSDRATAFLDAALAPTQQYVIRPSVVTPAGFSAVDLAHYRAVVLADVPSLTPADTAKLEDFVRAGNGLLIAPGARVKPEVYNASLWKEGEGLLPAQMISVAGDPASRDKPFMLHLSGLTHETLQLLADPERSDLQETQIWRYFKLAPPAGTAGSAVILRLEGGDPFLVEKDFGRGRVLMTSAPLDASWSNLFMRTSFVVLTHEMVYYLSSPLIPARNVPAGEPLVVSLDEATLATAVDVNLPMGGQRTLPVERREGRRVAVLADTNEGGLYEVAYTGRRGEVKEYYVVNVEPEESDLTPLSNSARETLQGRPGMTFYTDWARVEASLKAGQGTREFWRWLAILTVLMLIVEIALTRWFSRRRASEVEGVQFGVSQ